MTRVRRMSQTDDGVALVMALVFVLIVSIFVTTALSKSESVSASGQQIRARGDLQYTLDGGVERGLQLLRSDLAQPGDPTKCTEPPATPGTTVALGNLALQSPVQTVSMTCETLAGRAAKKGDAANSNYAVITTDTAPGALTTQSGISTDLLINGSVFMNGKVSNSDIKKPIQVQSGDIVSPLSRSGCAADLAALTSVVLGGTGTLKACTEQTLAEAMPTVVLDNAPTSTVGSTLLNGTVNLNVGSIKCRIFYPGKYMVPPSLDDNGSNYFTSGRYYFENIGNWTIKNNAEILGGQRVDSGDTAVPNASKCKGVTDAMALAAAPLANQLEIGGLVAPQGNVWQFGGSSALLVGGEVTLYSPATTAGQVPLSIMAARPSDTSKGYIPSTVTGKLISNNNASASLQLNAKLFVPNSNVTLFASNPTVAVARGGVVARSLDLGASAAADTLAISAPGGSTKPPPPFRTVRVVAQDSAGSATNVSVASISNFGTYDVTVHSWRTGLTTD